MTNEEKNQIGRLRAAGYSYRRIATELDISVNSIKSYCRRHGFGMDAHRYEIQLVQREPCPEPNEATSCAQCGSLVRQVAGRKRRRFCSDVCRLEWWAAHRGELHRKAMGKLSDDRMEIIRAAEMLRTNVYDTSALYEEQEQTEKRLAEAAQQLTQAIMRNASVALDQSEHQREMTRLSARYQDLQARNDALTQEITEKNSRRRRMDSFIKELKKLPQHAEIFNPVTFRILVERITVYDGSRIVVRFNDGTEVQA